jgi:hypothetical protein
LLRVWLLVLRCFVWVRVLLMLRVWVQVRLLEWARVMMRVYVRLVVRHVVRLDGLLSEILMTLRRYVAYLLRCLFRCLRCHYCHLHRHLVVIGFDFHPLASGIGKHRFNL